MSNDRFHDEVRRLIEQNGAMGVNQLSKALDVPLSTMQKYMDKDQNYFKKNHARKWELPEMSANSDIATVAGNYTNVIESQLMSMQALIDTLMASFRATVSLIDANKGLSPVSTGKPTYTDPDVAKMYEDIKLLTGSLKKKMSDIPEEYQDLLSSTNWVSLTLQMGRTYVTNNLNPEIVELILGNTDKLSDEVLKMLEEYQK